VEPFLLGRQFPFKLREFAVFELGDAI